MNGRRDAGSKTVKKTPLDQNLTAFEDKSRRSMKSGLVVDFSTADFISTADFTSTADQQQNGYHDSTAAAVEQLWLFYCRGSRTVIVILQPRQQNGFHDSTAAAVEFG